MKTAQELLKAKLESINLPHREIRCYGSQITVECMSNDACLKWADIISKFATIKGIIKTDAYAKKNKKMSVNLSVVEVYRLYAMIR
jgi:hypothetical protein